MERFATAVTCIDGRAYEAAVAHVRRRFFVDHVDLITEPGAVAVAGGDRGQAAADALLDKVAISLEAHQSVGIAVAAHHDCAGNPVAREVQLEQLRQAVARLRARFPGLEVIALWQGESWQPEEVT